MKLLKFNHANLNTPIVVDADMMFSHYYSAHHKATLIMAVGGGMVPVSETVEQVTEKLEAAKNQSIKEKINDTRKTKRRNDQVQVNQKSSL